MPCRVRIVLALLAALIGPCSVVSAQSFHYIGTGGASCGEWTADRRFPDSSRSQADEQWVLGFLSAVGYVDPDRDPLHGMDADGVWAWVDNYCRDHPIDMIISASEAFLHAHPN